jgi:LysM repeat protein
VPAKKPASKPTPSQVKKPTPKPQNKPVVAQNKPQTTKPKPTTTSAVSQKPTTQQKLASVVKPTAPKTVPARTQPKPTTTVKPKPVAAKPKATFIKSATGKMQTSNVAVLQSKNAKSEGSKFVYYKVKAGETLFSIQRKHDGSNIQDIINMNNLRDNGNKIYPNQVLKIRLD